MSRIRNALTAGAIALGSSAAMLTGGIAKADPAPAPAPTVPGLSMLTQLINPSTAPQLLQAATAMFNPKPAVTPATAPITPGTAPIAPAAAPLAPAAAAAPAPLATAALNLPQVPAAPAAVQPPILGNSGDLPASALPSGQLNIPNLPNLPVPLPAQLSFPGDLASLMPGAPGATTGPGYPVPTAAANSPMPGIGALFPTSALP